MRTIRAQVKKFVNPGDLCGYTEFSGVSLTGDLTLKTPITSYDTLCDWHFHPLRARARKLLKKHKL